MSRKDNDNGGKLFGNGSIKELRNFMDIIRLKLRKYEPAWQILTGALGADLEQLTIFGLDLDDFYDSQSNLGTDLLETFTPAYREVIRQRMPSLATDPAMGTALWEFICRRLKQTFRSTEDLSAAFNSATWDSKKTAIQNIIAIQSA